jgi:3-hydroxyacyl-CoA dehydrogenase
MTNRNIKKVAVLGSGVMGSRIACHFAGAGVPVLLLDMIPEAAASSARASDRNILVNEALTAAVKSSPSPLYFKDALKLIRTGNFTDNMKDIAEADWIIEVVVERLDIKKRIFEDVEKYRRAGTLITSNTSGIPIHLMAEGRSEDFQKHFCGTHFFNPPRYLRLLEIIPGPATDRLVVDFLMHFGDLILGKTTVLCKDSPAFIANRVGVFSMMAIFNLSRSMGFSTEEVDAMTGPLTGKPKSASYRTADVVGLDTLVKVAEGIYQNCPADEAREQLKVPDWLRSMVEKKFIGDKSGSGFYKKIKKDGGKAEIHVLDTDTMEYRPSKKVTLPALDVAKQIDDLGERLRLLTAGHDKTGEFYTKFHCALFSYVANRIPEISDLIYPIDDAIKAGFGWELGPFETWDILGFKKMNEAIRQCGLPLPLWIKEMEDAGVAGFYSTQNNKRCCYDITSRKHEVIPGSEAFIVPAQFADKTVWSNSNCRLVDTGDQILALEWSTKMNSMGGEVLEAIQRAVSIAEEKYRGLIIANSGAQFSAGANVGLLFMLAADQEHDELDMAIRMFQNSMMRVRYSSIPVVVAPHGLALGGGCELCLHADKVIAAAETYTGLVEAGIGVIPGGGGTKEFVLRAADEIHQGEPETITLQNRFLTIATGKVSTSAHEAFELGIYRKGHDEISMNSERRIARAKMAALEMSEAGYVMPVRRNDIRVAGRSVLGALYAGINGMWRGKYATDHDVIVAKKLAYVMCGGDLSEPGTVSEQYLLDLEREAFLSLCGERKSLERMQSVLTTGKPVRN